MRDGKNDWSTCQLYPSSSLRQMPVIVHLKETFSTASISSAFLYPFLHMAHAILLLNISITSFAYYVFNRTLMVNSPHRAFSPIGEDTVEGTSCITCFQLLRSEFRTQPICCGSAQRKRALIHPGEFSQRGSCFGPGILNPFSHTALLQTNNNTDILQCLYYTWHSALPNLSGTVISCVNRLNAEFFCIYCRRNLC